VIREQRRAGFGEGQLRRAQEVASSFDLPVMIHMGQTISPIAKLVGLLKRGDIVIEAIMKTGFWPDTFSTDWTGNSRTTGVIDFPNCMSKLLGHGMSVSDAIARATWNPSRIFPAFRDRGTLYVGSPADIAVLELREGNFEFLGNFKNTITGHQRFFPAGTVLGGKRIPRSA